MGSGLRRVKAIIFENLDIPEDVIENIPRITMVGNNEISIENHKGIKFFQEDIIKINSRLGEISLEGKNINILYMSKTTIVISGEFKGICYK